MPLTLIPIWALTFATWLALPATVPGVDEPGVLSGAWEGAISGPSLELELHIPGGQGDDRWTLGAPCDSLPGLTESTGDGSGSFEMTLDVGRFLFVGTFLGQGGRGGFTFVPDAGYAGDLVSLGIQTLRPEDFLTLAERGVARPAIRNLVELGYRVWSLEELIGMTGSVGDPRAIRLLDPEG